MKEKMNSFLQSVSMLVKAQYVNMHEGMHRRAAAMLLVFSMTTVITLTVGDFANGESHAMIALAETQEQTENEAAAAVASMEETTAHEHMEQTDNDAAETDRRTLTIENASAMLVSEKMEEAKREGEKARALEEEKRREAEKAANAVTLSEKDHNVLLRIVQAEAGGCDEEGKLLVANVILNRVENDEFPNSVTGVVYQRNQFSPVSDGSLDRAKVSDETRRAVARALEGEDISEGALYFMNRGRSSSRNVRWFDSRLDYLFKHGDHEFFK